MITGILGTSKKSSLVRDIGRLGTEWYAGQKPAGESNVLSSVVSVPARVVNIRGDEQAEQTWKLGLASQSSARSDNLLLPKWVNIAQGSDASGSDPVVVEIPIHSSHAAFLSKYAFLDFSEEQYEKTIKSLDPAWSFEETKYLVSLVLQFEMRFNVVVDRYSYPNRPAPVNPNRMDESEDEDDNFAGWSETDFVEQKPIEEIKARFYSVAKALVEAEAQKARPEPSKRSKAGTESAKESVQRNPFVKFVYDPVAEKNRRALLEKQYLWDPEQDKAEAEFRTVLATIDKLIEVAGKQHPKQVPAANVKHESDAGVEIGALPGSSESANIAASVEGKIHERFQRSLLPLSDLTLSLKSVPPGVTSASKLLASTLSGFNSSYISLQSTLYPSARGGSVESLAAELDGRIDRTVWNAVKACCGTVTTGFDDDEMTGISKKRKATALKQSRGNDWVGTVFSEFDECDPKIYFEKVISNLKPPIMSLLCCQAYMHMKLDASVVFKLKSHRDILGTTKEEWLQKIQNLRKIIQVAQKRLPPAQNKG